MRSNYGIRFLKCIRLCVKNCTKLYQALQYSKLDFKKKEDIVLKMQEVGIWSGTIDNNNNNKFYVVVRLFSIIKAYRLSCRVSV